MTSQTGAPARRVWIALVIAAFVAASVVGGMALATRAEERGAAVDPSPAPDFELPELYSGQPVRLADFVGRPVVVNYWASWCAPCLAEMPAFEAVAQRYRDAVAFVGINIADEPRSAKAVIVETGVTYTLLRDDTGQTFSLFGGFGMPTTIFVAADGTIREMHTGGLTGRQLTSKIESYFGV